MSIDPNITPQVPATPDDPDQQQPDLEPAPGGDEPVPATEPVTKPH